MSVHIGEALEDTQLVALGGRVAFRNEIHLCGGQSASQQGFRWVELLTLNALRGDGNIAEEEKLVKEPLQRYRDRLQDWRQWIHEALLHVAMAALANVGHLAQGDTGSDVVDVLAHRLGDMIPTPSG